MKNTYIIQNRAGQFLAFNNRWTEEYPEARKVSVFIQAARLATKALRSGQTQVRIVQNYGTEDQKVFSEFVQV